MLLHMAQRDGNQDALRQGEKATESEPVHGEDWLESNDLKQKCEDAHKALRPVLPAGNPSGEESV